MNDIERRYELKSLELEVQIKASERKMADISYNERQIVKRNNFTKERFENLKKKLKSLPASNMPKVACQKATVLGSSMDELKASIKETRKELIVLRKDLSKEKKSYLKNKNLMERIDERHKILKQEKAQISEMKEQDTLIEDLVPYKIESTNLSLLKNSDISIPSSFNENRQRQDTQRDNSSDQLNSGPVKKDENAMNFKEHSLCVDVESERGDLFTIDLHDEGGLSVNILAPSEREKSSLLRQKDNLKRELSSLGIPLAALLIRKRGE